MSQRIMARPNATPTMLIDNHTKENLLDGIANQGYAIIDQFLPPDIIKILADEAKSLHDHGQTRRALTGKKSGEKPDNMRGDFIHWIDEANASTSQQQYLQCMEELRNGLNQNLYLGLFDLEAHFAVYPPGASYRRHLDQFNGDSKRQVSCILYLNDNWQADEGGQLRLYLEESASPQHMDIQPEGGRLVTFLSGRFWHEVLPATRERISLTGWFRTR
ncbi:MAG TPA: 2OG-Fe(II) oxygenase [Methylophilaceae bacterium]|nr:2OG-Fe(II) oxygenase [Methylophilaceae bacterium]